MNNYSTNNQMRQYELEEAKKRMGTYAGGYSMTNTTANAMTNATSGGAMYNATTVGAQSQLKSSEKMKAQEDMNKNTMF
ncbi:hypothetical protein [Maledivibacter halophilus]|uniref:Uncharacterized protein n=1 Tax=Maledivibacter halophilus TaxID=36842 RepID=A0A1T5JC05_9FIRM|nr:hypothetical protein [Maledivibacter halophilus]SKC48929.1 hypothetical protein SAMN02194393_01080 [Maledivibacter halophilus]